MKNQLLIIVFISVFGSLHGFAQFGFGDDIEENIPQFSVDKFINKVSDRFNNPNARVSGYQFTLSKNGNLYYQESDGYAIHPLDDNGGSGRKYINNTRQNISSVSKFLCTIVLANVLEEYNIDWGDPVSSYLPWSWVNSMATEHNDSTSLCYLTFEKLVRHRTCLDFNALNRNGDNNSGGYQTNAQMDKFLMPEELNTGSFLIDENSGDTLTYNIDDYRNGNFALTRMLIANIWELKNNGFFLNPLTEFYSTNKYLELLDEYIYAPLGINAPIDMAIIDSFHNSSHLTPLAYQYPFNTDNLTCEGNLGWKAGSHSLPHNMGGSSMVLRTEELANILAFFKHDDNETIISAAQRLKILSDTLGLSTAEGERGITDFGFVYMKRGGRGPGCNDRGTRSAIMLFPNGYELSILTNCRFNQFDKIAKEDFEDSWSKECNAFKHVSAESSIFGNRTKIDNTSTNSDPDKLLFIAHDFTRSQQISPSPLGVYYDQDKWWIFNQNGQDMTTEKRFNVFALDDNYPGAFKHTHVPDFNDSNSHISVVDHPSLNNNPDAKLLITQNYGTSGGVGNNDAIGVWYNGTNWTVFNQDLSVMPEGAMFNILVDHPNVITVNVSAPFGSFFGVPISQLPDQDLSQLLFTTNSLSPNGQFNNDNVGVWYTNDQWFLYNENGNFFFSQAKVNVLSLEDCECCGIDAGIRYVGCTNTIEIQGGECATLNDTIQCAEDFVLFLPEAIHNCEYVKTVFTSFDTASFSKSHWITTRFTATNRGLSNNDKIRTVVLDILPPVITGIPNDTIVQCAIPPIPEVVIVSDNCTPDIIPEYSEVIEGTDCNFKITRTWTAVDALGNSITKSYRIYSGTFSDQDNDGSNVLLDCDDNDPNNFIEKYYPDLDLDGYGDNDASFVLACTEFPPADHVTNNLDCDDNNPDDEMIEINEPLTESATYKAIRKISSSSQIIEGVDITFQVGVSCTLLKNFEVRPSTRFEIVIESCGNQDE